MAHDRGMVAAILAAILACSIVPSPARAAPPRTDLSRPIEFRSLKRIDSDDRIDGRLVAWDFESFWLADGADATARHAWADFDRRQVYDRVRMLIVREDKDDAAMWCRLGSLMYRLAEPDRAERALATAAARGAPQAWISAVRTPPHTMPEDAPDSREPPDGAGPTPTHPPEPDGGPDTGKPLDESPDGPRRIEWPDLTADQRLAATERLKQLCASQITTLNHRMQLVETDHFLFYTDAGAAEHTQWAAELERMYDTLIDALELPDETDLFNGKCVIWVFLDRDRFLAYETAIHGYDARSVRGICHQRGADCFVAFYRGSGGDDFSNVLVHETVHAFIHRYRSPLRLPTWANEGLANYIAGHLVERSTEPRLEWQHTRQFLQQGGDPLAVMGQSYEDGTWFDENSYPISHMLIRFMLKHEPRKTKEWIDDIKAGKNWRESLELRFGATQEALVKRFREDLLAEPSYSRVR